MYANRNNMNRRYVYASGNRKNTARNRLRLDKRIHGYWPDGRTHNLILAVERRPELYTTASSLNRSPKDQLWKDVAAEIGSPDDWADCRAKWQGLRVSYRVNMALLKQKCSDQATTDELPKVSWRFFDAMSFLDTNESRPPCAATESNFNFSLNDDDVIEVPSIDASQGDSSMSLPAPRLNFQTNRQYGANYTEESPQLPSAAERSSHIQPMPEESIPESVVRNHEHDRHCAYGDYIAEELRYLPVAKACQLKRLIGRTMLMFFDKGHDNFRQAAESTKDGLESGNDEGTTDSIRPHINHIATTKRKYEYQHESFPGIKEPPQKVHQKRSAFGDHVNEKLQSYSSYVRNQVEFKISQVLYEADMGYFDGPPTSNTVPIRVNTRLQQVDSFSGCLDDAETEFKQEENS